jgi:hypothetical protein
LLSSSRSSSETEDVYYNIAPGDNTGIRTSHISSENYFCAATGFHVPDLFKLGIFLFVFFIITSDLIL